MASLDLAHSRSPADLFGDPTDDSNPLWFKKDLFLSPNFDSESYISDLRTFVPFDTLRSQLQSHLSALKHELVELINRDYNDFVNLSTKLVDVDSAIARMRAPLTDLRDKIVAYRDSVESSLISLQNGLRERAEAANAREVLELLLDTFHVVSKVEKLIKELPSVPADWSNGDVSSSDDYLVPRTSSEHTENGSNMRETQSMLLERIASEMNRLKFYMAHAQNLPFIENMEKRIQNTSLLLDSSLGHCFVDGLEHRDENVIYNCLRAYAAIDKTGSAEEIFRTKVVAPVIERVIPHGSSTMNGRAAADELEEDFQEIIQQLDKECKFLLEISSTENSGLHVFDFLANSILKEVFTAIQMGKPGSFSPGRPTQFLRNYRASLDFLAHLEGYCPSRSAVSQFRAQPVYVEFMKQWNIGVYFSLRFQEIAGTLDSALTPVTLEVVRSSDPESRNTKTLMLKQSATLMECLRSCWSEDVLVHSSCDKFLRLCLQLLSRYTHWLSSGLSARLSGNTNSSSGSEGAVSTSTEDLIYVIHDIDLLVSEVSGDYIQKVLQVLSSCPTEVQDLVKQSVLHSVKCLDEQTSHVMNSIIEALVEKSVEDLRQLKGITATYRMTKKPIPVRHSPYVSGVLRPLKAFLENERTATHLTNDTKNKVLQGAAFEITRRYYELASDLVSVARKTESSLQRLRQGAQKRVGASSDVSDQNISDTDKICMQLFLDIQEFGRNLAVLGVDASEIEAYRLLWQFVAPQDKQNNINFQ